MTNVLHIIELKLYESDVWMNQNKERIFFFFKCSVLCACTQSLTLTLTLNTDLTLTPAYFSLRALANPLWTAQPDAFFALAHRD